MGTLFTEIFPAQSFSPGLTEQICQFPYGNAVFLIRAHVIIALLMGLFGLLLHNGQIGSQRFQYMLKRAYGIRISQNNFLFCQRCPDTVRDNPVFCKIPASDNISGSGSGNCHIPAVKKGFFITVGDQFRT